MIKQIIDSKDFLEICDKLEKVKDCRLTKKALYNFMVAGLFHKKTFVYASYENNKMNGCSVIHINEDITGELKLFLVFQWIDVHHPKLWKEYMKFIEAKAKEFKAKKISFTTARNEKAIERRLGKYGYKKIYSIVEKEVI